MTKMYFEHAQVVIDLRHDIYIINMIIKIMII